MALEIPSSSVWQAVTPADGTDLPNGRCRALWIGVAGVVVVNNNGVTLTITAPAGLVPINVTRVLATSTTATSIFAIY